MKRVTLDAAIALVRDALVTRAITDDTRQAFELVAREARKPRRQVVAIPFPQSEEP